eukprot:SAG11_NODE_2122_length_3784_cov_3.569878_8_plen_28_part_01
MCVGGDYNGFVMRVRSINDLVAVLFPAS